jgi:amidase
MKISIGLVAHANQVADKDAIAVQTLRQAGAVVYVKTTMPQSGMVSELSWIWNVSLTR